MGKKSRKTCATGTKSQSAAAEEERKSVAAVTQGEGECRVPGSDLDPATTSSAADDAHRETIMREVWASYPETDAATRARIESLMVDMEASVWALGTTNLTLSQSAFEAACKDEFSRLSEKHDLGQLCNQHAKPTADTTSLSASPRSPSLPPPAFSVDQPQQQQQQEETKLDPADVEGKEGTTNLTDPADNACINTTTDAIILEPISTGIESDGAPTRRYQETTQHAVESAEDCVNGLLSSGYNCLKDDPDLAICQFREAAVSGGSAQAMHLIGCIYAVGSCTVAVDSISRSVDVDITKDVPLGLRFLRAAIAYGHEDAKTVYHVKVDRERMCTACGKPFACKKCKRCGARYCDSTCQMVALRHPKTSHTIDCDPNTKDSHDILGLID